LINDGLMTIFFLLIGLELEREIYLGELSNIKMLLPILRHWWNDSSCRTVFA
jgi:NhaA family Na+:H+ antiporter